MVVNAMKKNIAGKVDGKKGVRGRGTFLSLIILQNPREGYDCPVWLII